MLFASFLIAQSNPRHSHGQINFRTHGISHSPTCMISRVCISMHMHNSCFINSCIIILIDHTCVKAHTWHVFPTPLNFGSHLPMGLEINSSQNSHFCMTLQYFAFMTHGEYFCLCVNFLSFLHDMGSIISPMLSSLSLSLSPSLSHDASFVPKQLLHISGPPCQIMPQSQFVAMATMP